MRKNDETARIGRRALWRRSWAPFPAIMTALALRSVATDFGSTWAPKPLRIAERIFSANVMLAPRTEAGCRARPRALGRGPLRRLPPITVQRPSPNLRPRLEAGKFWVSANALAAEIEEHELIDAAAGQTSAISEGRDRSVVSSGRFSLLAFFKISKPSAKACIRPYSMPLCTILTKCPAPFGPAWIVALLGARIAAIAAGRARHVTGAWGERLEDRVEPVDDLLRATDHHANNRAPVPRRRRLVPTST